MTRMKAHLDPLSSKPAAGARPGWLVVLLALAACSSSSEAGPMTYQAFSERLCDLQMPCCVAQSLPSNGVACRRAMQLVASLVEFDPTAAEACLAETAAAQSSASFCRDQTGAPIGSCAQATRQKRGSKTPGQACTSDTQCAQAPSTQVYCNAPEFGEKGICQQLLAGKAGDGPCLGTRFAGDGIAYTAREETQALSVAVLCDEGLRCNRETLKCEVPPPPPPRETSETCASWNEWETCGEEGYCDQATDKCVPRKADGASCAGPTQCLFDVSYCSLESGLCAPKHANGAACSSDDQCVEDECRNGRCVADFGSDLTWSIVCGGD